MFANQDLHIGRLPPLIDAETGAVSLLLVPFHLDRLHGEWRGEPAPEGFPFPIRTDVEPSVFTFRSGQSVEEIAATIEIESNSEGQHCSVHSYALCPFGWALYVSPRFANGQLRRLSFVGFRMSADAGPITAVSAEVMRRLGKYDESLHHTWYSLRKARAGERVDGHVWKRAWGEVWVFLDARDNEPCLEIKWRS